MMEIPDDVAEFYRRRREGDRLLSALGQLELRRMQELLPRFFPAAPARVADVGGGPGTYACWLADKGYDVHLVDPVEHHVEQAMETSRQRTGRKIASCVVGDARQLEFADASMDAVLLHGPLYHLAERADRVRALVEASRVLRPGGVVAGVSISAYASATVGLVNGSIFDPAYFAMVGEEVETGLHRRPPELDVFTTGFFHRPEMLPGEFKDAGLDHRITLGIQGPGWLVPEFEAAWKDPAKRNTIMEVARLMEDSPLHSPHILSIATKPA